MVHDKNCFQKAIILWWEKRARGGGWGEGVGWYTALKLSAVSMQTLCLLCSRLIIDSYILFLFRVQDNRDAELAQGLDLFFSTKKEEACGLDWSWGIYSWNCTKSRKLHKLASSIFMLCCTEIAGLPTFQRNPLQKCASSVQYIGHCTTVYLLWWFKKNVLYSVQFIFLSAAV